MSDFDDELHAALAAGAGGAPTSSDLAAAARMRHRRRRRRAVAGAAAATVIAVATPVVLLAGGDDTADPSPLDEPAPSSDIRVGCSGDASWPVEAMDRGVVADVSEAEIRRAFDVLLAAAPMDAPHAIREQGPQRAEYVVLSVTDLEVTLGVGTWSAVAGPGDDASYLTLERSGDGLQAVGWGDCQLTVALPAGRAQVEVRAPKGGVDPGTTELTVLVNERECTSGRDPGPYLGEPTVVEETDRVLVTVTSEAMTGGADCQGNPSIPMTIQLDEPLGDRELHDAGTWPPTPIPAAAPEAEGDDWHTIGWRGVEVDVPSAWTRTDCPVVGVRFGPPYDHLPDRPHDGECLRMSGAHISRAAGFDESPLVEPGRAYASGPGVPQPVQWSGYVIVGDWLVQVDGPSRDVTERILGSVR